MDSWEPSACYPRRTFYPLSDGPSTRDHRITMTDFRLCSSCHSRSQAGLCHCTQQLISDQLEPTIARLRYSLGGDRPSQTTRHARSRAQIHGSRLDIKEQKGGISRMPPHTPERMHQKLPPILRSLIRIPMPSYSKGSRGLFVLPRVTRIFTRTPISLGLLLRQWGSRYAIRAGRNLPD